MKKLFITTFFFLVSYIVTANDVTPQDAKSIAQSFFSEKGINLKSEPAPYRAPRKRAVGSNADKSYYYVFNAENEQGYVIISGDDRTEQVLGYVENGSFDAENIPDNMRSWLQTYADQIQHLDDNNIQIDGEAARAQSRARRASKTRFSVPQLLKSRWGQGYPYNSSCPDFYRSDGTTAKPAAGCVATAIAQVMNYYKYPSEISNSIPQHSITYDFVAPNGALTTRTSTAKMVRKGTKIDWDNICDVYNDDCNDAQRKAVADLMLYVGQSVKMGWNSSSGAYFGSDAGPSLIKYFGYNEGTRAVYRSDYTIDQWVDLLYEELSTGHPVGYSGQSSGGGHAFVVDGFDGDQLFHLNWGWNGGSDGWFLINILNPGDNSGIGASNSSDGYSRSQCALIGVNPRTEEKEETHVAMSIENVSCSGTTVTGRFINWTGKINSFYGGVVVYDVENEVYEYLEGTETLISNVGTNIVRTHTFELNQKLEPGTYRLSLASRLTSNPTYRPEWNCVKDYILAEVDENRVPKLSLVFPKQDIVVENVEYKGTLAKGEEQEVIFTFKNNADEYFQELRLYASVNDEKIFTNCRSQVTVKAGETASYSFYFTPDSISKYNLWICKSGDTDNPIYHTTVDIVDPADAQKASLKLNSVKVANASNGIAYSNLMDGELVILNQKTIPFKGRVYIQIWGQIAEGSSTYRSGSSCVRDVEIDAKRTANVPFRFENLTYNRNYEIVVYYVGQEGTIDNGGLWKDHSFYISPGLLYWKKDGTITGVADKTTFTVPNTACGVLFENSSITTIRKNRNPNTIYAVNTDGEAPTGVEDYNFVLNAHADTVNFTNNYAFYSPLQFTADHATFTYEVPAIADSIKWDDVTFPFAPKAAMIDNVVYPLNSPYNPFFIYGFTHLLNDNTPLIGQVEEIHGEAPYLIAADSSIAGKSIVFFADDVLINKTGSVKMIVGSNAYNFYGTTLQAEEESVYVLNANGSAFVKEDRSTIDPFNTYFTTSLSDNEALTSIVLPDVPKYVPNPNPDAIEFVESFDTNNEVPVYTITGIQVGNTTIHNGVPVTKNLQPGIYVINRRKVFVK